MKIGIKSDSNGLVFFNEALFGFLKNLYIREFKIINENTSDVT